MLRNPWREGVIVGGGGHARVIVDALQSQGLAPRGVLDPDPTLRGATLYGVPVLGGDERLPQLAREGVTHFIVGLGGVGDNGPRRRLFDLAVAQGLAPWTVRHPSAVCSPRAAIGAGSFLGPAVVVNAGAVIGVNVILNSGAIVEHDGVVGDHAHIASGACLGGGVRVGPSAHIGAGATVRQGVTIGAAAIVGAGAVVVQDVAPATVVAGVPARLLAAAHPPAPAVERA